MLWFTIFAALISIALGVTVDTFLDGRIIGGKDTPIEQISYQVSIQEDNEHICGGSILSNKHILTAAHCFFGVKMNTITVMVGFTKLDTADVKGIRYKVASLTEHPRYAYPYNDIAILTLDGTLKFGPGVAVIAPVAKGYDAAPGSKVVVSGWGINEDNDWSNHLKKVEVEIVNRRNCREKYISSKSEITDAMICAGTDNGGKDACEGDSGEPLVEKGVLIGVASHGEECGNRKFPFTQALEHFFYYKKLHNHI